MTVVRLVRFPVLVAAEAEEQFEGLKREFTLLTMADHAGPDLPRRLLELIAALTTEYAEATAEPDRLRREALARGEAEIGELVYQSPDGSEPAAILVASMLDDADEYCQRDDLLLTLATPPHLLAYRRWYFGEFVAQLRGLPPLAWPDADQDTLATTPTLRGA